MDKKFVLPGDYIASCEEFVSGKNTYSKEDGIYSSSAGEVIFNGHNVDVIGSFKTIEKPAVGNVVYCVIVDMMDTRAFVECSPLESDNSRMTAGFSAVLPVSNIRKGFVENIRDEIRVGDIVKAKVSAVSPNVELTIVYPEFGVVKAFCSRCRSKMVLNDNKLVCSKCSRTENRKLAQI